MTQCIQNFIPNERQTSENYPRKKQGYHDVKDTSLCLYNTLIHDLLACISLTAQFMQHAKKNN